MYAPSGPAPNTSWGGTDTPERWPGGHPAAGATARRRPWPGKGIHYRMRPANAGCLTAAGLDCCALADNHVLDWGREGLIETFDTLTAEGRLRLGWG